MRLIHGSTLAKVIEHLREIRGSEVTSGAQSIVSAIANDEESTIDVGEPPPPPPGFQCGSRTRENSLGISTVLTMA